MDLYPSETTDSARGEAVEPSVGLPQRNLLLNLPGSLLAEILDFYFSLSPALWLWMTGCRDLQARLARHVSQISFESRKVTKISDLKGMLPNFLGSFPLRKLRLVCSVGNIDYTHTLPTIASVLLSLHPGLKHLDVKMSVISNTSTAILFNTQSRHPNRAFTPLLDINKAFPQLEELQVDRYASLCVDRFPSSLTALVASLDTTDSSLAKLLPKGLTSWDGMGSKSVTDDDAPFFAALPPSIAYLGYMTNDLLVWPPQLASVSLARMDAAVAQALPRSLTSLKVTKVYLQGLLEVIESLPPALVSLELKEAELFPKSGSIIDACTLRKLPRSLTVCIASIDVTEIQKGDWPPGLTQLKLLWRSKFDSNSGALAALLPRSMTSLTIPKLDEPLEPEFFSNLPPGIVELRCCASNIIVSRDNLVFPPALTSLGMRGLSDHSKDYPPLFPFRELPQTLTELCIGEMDIALSDLVYLPPLNRLELSKFHTREITPSPQLLEKAKALRQFGLPFEKRSAPDLTMASFSSLRLWDLLPKTLNALHMRKDDRHVDEDLKELGDVEKFPYLKDLRFAP